MKGNKMRSAKLLCSHGIKPCLIKICFGKASRDQYQEGDLMLVMEV